YQLQYVVNTLPVDTSINVNTASRETILALLDDVTESEISAIAEGRPYETLAEFYQGLAAVINVPVTELQQRIPPGFISVDSEYFLLEAEMELGAVHLAYRSVLQRATTGETHAISRTVRYIPRIQAKDGERSPQITGCRSSEANRV
ncbi:MAG: type II secretion system protein GspK, partial [bacterium]